MDAPKIEFPCVYPIKVILDNDLAAIAEVETIARRYDSKLQDQIEVQPSKKGAYVSVRLSFWATSLSQIESLFAELKQLSAVRMVL